MISHVDLLTLELKTEKKIKPNGDASNFLFTSSETKKGPIWSS